MPKTSLLFFITGAALTFNLTFKVKERARVPFFFLARSEGREG